MIDEVAVVGMMGGGGESLSKLQMLEKGLTWRYPITLGLDKTEIIASMWCDGSEHRNGSRRS
jgi:hypothetical protein